MFSTERHRARPCKMYPLRLNRGSLWLSSAQRLRKIHVPAPGSSLTETNPGFHSIGSIHPGAGGCAAKGRLDGASPALLPWLTVLANVQLAARFRSADQPPRQQPEDVLRMVGLEDVLHVYRRRFPAACSSGWRSRARC